MPLEFVWIGNNLKNVKATAYALMTLTSFTDKNKIGKYGYLSKMTQVKIKNTSD